MNKKRISLQLALDQLASVYQSENLLKAYLNVLQNKASNEDLKWQIFGQIHVIQERSKYLKAMLAYFEKDNKADSCEGIRGIVQSGLKLIQKYKDGAARDMALVHALLMIHHYKLGVYKTILTYFDTCGLKTENSFMLKCVQEEEHTIEVLSSMDVIHPQVMGQHNPKVIY